MDELPARRYIIALAILSVIAGLIIGFLTAPYGFFYHG